VHARPGASRSEVAGTHGDALTIRVAAPPVDGAANRELLRVLAEVLEVRPGALALRRGAHGREKRIVVTTLDEATIAARIMAKL